MTLSSNTTRTVSFVNASGHDAHKPSGCTATITGSSSLVKVYFNEESTTIACTASIQCICTVNPKPFGQATGALLYHTTNQTADKGSGKADHFGGGGRDVMNGRRRRSSSRRTRHATCAITAAANGRAITCGLY